MRVSQDTFTKEQLNITNVKIPSTVSSTFANRHKPSRRPKFAKELETLPPEKNNFFKFPPLLKNFKTCHRTADTASETHTDSSLTMTEDRRPAYNMRLASCGVKCLNSSSVFQINFSAGLTVLCSEIPHERQAQKRYGQVKKTT